MPDGQSISRALRRRHQREADDALPEDRLQRRVGLALHVHEAHGLAALVLYAERLLGAIAAHVDHVHVDLEHVLRPCLEELSVLEQGLHGDGPAPVHELVVAHRDGTSEVLADARALHFVRAPDPVAVAAVQQPVRKARTSEGLHVCRGFQPDAGALSRRV